MGDAEDYGMPAVQPPAPLFARAVEGPFARSEMRPTPLEGLVAGIIWRHQGRENPVPLMEVIRLAGCKLPALSERKLKEIVQQLRVAHRCPIGARRAEPVGYFWIADAEDHEYALRPYREQVIEMFRVLRALDSRGRLSELLGQLTLD